MAAVTAPLLSFSASGTIAKTMTFASWKGILYSRRYVIPSNPDSAGQQMTRSVFSWLQNYYKFAGADQRLAYDAYIQGKPLTAANALIQQSLPVLRPGTSLEGLRFSPGAKGGIAIPLDATPAPTTIAIDGTPPSTLPPGWTAKRAIAALMLDVDPHLGDGYLAEVGEADGTPNWTITFTGLDNTTDYAVGCWIEYQRSMDVTDLAYGASSAEIVTTTM